MLDQLDGPWLVMDVKNLRSNDQGEEFRGAPEISVTARTQKYVGSEIEFTTVLRVLLIWRVGKLHGVPPRLTTGRFAMFPQSSTKQRHRPPVWRGGGGRQQKINRGSLPAVQGAWRLATGSRSHPAGEPVG